MAKMTIATLKDAIKTYVDATKQAGTWKATTDNLYGLIDKVGKIVTIDGVYQDKLPELDGDELPLGKTIEEYFVDLTLPQTWTDCATDGKNALTPAMPTVEAVAYSYTLGREKIKTTQPYDNLERAALTSEGASNMSAKILERLQNSYSLTRYATKKQLIGNAMTKSMAVASCKAQVAIPTDTATGEAFVKQIKNDVEEASFAHQGGLANALIGSAPELYLYVKKGVMSALEVDTYAGAFNREDLAMPCKIRVVDDFGADRTDKAWAFLVDIRGLKLHNSYNAIRTDSNGEGDFINFIRHFEDTAFISKFVYMKAYYTA